MFERILCKAMFIGVFTITDVIKLTTEFSKKELQDLGDVIYFMVDEFNRVVKIGLSTRLGGRLCNDYCNPNSKCFTTLGIISKANKHNLNKIAIYAIPIPKIVGTFPSIVDDLMYQLPISLLKEAEIQYTTEAKRFKEPLLFMTQRKSNEV